MTSEISLEEMRRMAAEIGLTQLTDEHVRQLMRATKTAQQRRAALPTADITPADEPAHIFLAERHAGR